MARTVDKFPAHEAIYKDASDNIRFSKLQQWRVTNYALLYAAVWLLSDEPPLNTCAGKAGITLIVTILWAFNIFVLFNTQSSIARFRDRIDWFYKTYFTPSERLELTMVPKTFWFDPTIFIGLLAVTSGAAVVTLAVVWARQT